MADHPTFSDLDSAMTGVTDEIHQAVTIMRPNEPPEHRFMVITDKLCELLLDTAREHLARAEANLKRVELETTALKARSREMWENLEAFNKELNEYSHESINIHERFLKKKGQ